MRAVQQSMTMAMAVNMASSTSGFVSPVGGGQPVTSKNPASQYVSANHSSRFQTSQQVPCNSNSNTGNTMTNAKHSRKRRVNSNALER